VKPSRSTNDDLIDRTIELWQPRLRRDLSREDARQIVENVSSFFGILAEWSRAEDAGPDERRGRTHRDLRQRRGAP
jgi:hypothetical protein